MSYLKFGVVAVALLVRPLHAQRIPGRDLLEFPIGALAEPPALSLESADGFRNPASILLPRDVRARAGTMTLLTGTEQTVSAQSLAVAAALPNRITVALSAVRASVDGITRTDTDPQSQGSDVPYNTLVFSALVAHQQTEDLTAGVALRYRSGEVDSRTRSTIGLDGGLVAQRLFRRDIRLGISTFLWNPGDGGSDEAEYTAAVDARVFGRDSLSSARVGYSYSHSQQFAREHYVFATGRVDGWVARAGVARSTAFGERNTRVRLGVGLHYARYILGVAREDSPAGLSPSYQFALSASFR